MTDYKSTEERVFAAWLREAFAKGLVTHSQYEPVTFRLAEPVTRINKKGKPVQHWKGLSYTPDWHIFSSVFETPLVIDGVVQNHNTTDVYIEIKGTFTRHVSRDLPIRLGLMIQKYDKFVKVLKIPDDLPWMPEKLPPECYNKNGTIAAKWRRQEI